MMHDLVLFIPVMILALGALLLVPYAAFTEDAKGTTWLAALVSVLAGVWTWLNPLTGGAFMTASGPLVLVTPMTLVVWMVLCAAFPFAMTLVGPHFKRLGKEAFKPEFAVLALLSLTGMAVLVAAHDFLTLYVALELMSFPLYILCAFQRDDARSSEAALKYFVLGALASGLYLFGVSLAYAGTGSTNFTNVLSVAMGAGQGVEPMAAVSMALVILAMVFKLSVAPFHVWTPDAYQGAPTPVTAFLGSLPKLAVLVVLMRLLALPFASEHALWQPLLMVMAVFSMFLGSAVALVQSDLKRLLAYSTIGNVGFILVGVATGTPGGAAGVLFYTVAYLVNTLGLFAVVTTLGAQPTRDDLVGLMKTRPWLTMALVVNLLSLAGIPPLAGFMGKFGVFAPAVAAGHAWLAVLGVLASGVALFYSLYLIKLAVFDAPISGAGKTPKMHVGLAVTLGLSVVFAIVFGLYPQPLVQLFQAAASGLF